MLGLEGEKVETKKRKVEIVRTTYQPTKAEKEEEIDLSHLEGMTPDEMADAVVQDIEIKYISRPRK